jgi:MOSC domain-containing protein YiiM
MDALLETDLRVGEALLRPTRRRPPCAHVEALAGEDGLAAALRDRGGLCCEVLEPGRIAVDDTAVVERAAPREAGAAIADRLRAKGSSTRDGDDGHDDIGR